MKICKHTDGLGRCGISGEYCVEGPCHCEELIEYEPVRHGYWENANGRPKTYIRKCSVCGKEAYFCGRGCSYKFCPNCGAKMDLEG